MAVPPWRSWAIVSAAMNMMMVILYFQNVTPTPCALPVRHSAPNQPIPHVTTAPTSVVHHHYYKESVLAASPQCVPDWANGDEFAAVNVALANPSDKARTERDARVHDYSPVYERLFNDVNRSCLFASRQIKLLELGLGYQQDGRSMKLYDGYLPGRLDYHVVELSDKAINGLNTTDNLSPQQKEHILKRITIGSSADVATLDEAVNKAGMFDIIVDDAFHNTDHVTIAFKHLFLRGLRPGGYYVIEDLQCAYQDHWGGTKENQLSRNNSVTMLQDLMAAQHYFWWRDSTNWQHIDFPFRLYKEINEWLLSIDCYREICVLRKRTYPLLHNPRKTD